MYIFIYMHYINGQCVCYYFFQFFKIIWRPKVFELFDWKLRLAVLASFKHWDLHYLIFGKDPTCMA